MDVKTDKIIHLSDSCLNKMRISWITQSNNSKKIHITKRYWWNKQEINKELLCVEIFSSGDDMQVLGAFIMPRKTNYALFYSAVDQHITYKHEFFMWYQNALIDSKIWDSKSEEHFSETNVVSICVSEHIYYLS